MKIKDLLKAVTESGATQCRRMVDVHVEAANWCARDRYSVHVHPQRVCVGQDESYAKCCLMLCDKSNK